MATPPPPDIPFLPQSQKPAHGDAKRNYPFGDLPVNGKRLCFDERSPSQNLKHQDTNIPLPNLEGFPPEKDLKSPYNLKELANMPEYKAWNLIPAQEGHYNHI